MNFTMMGWYANRNMGLLLLVVVGFVAVTMIYADNTTTDIPIYDCKRIMGRIAKKVVKAFLACTKEVKANSTNKELEKKMNCIVKCSLGKFGMLTEDGLVTKDTVQIFMDKMVPPEAHELGHMLAEDCVNDYGSKLDKNQPYCESYGDFTTCMQNTLGEFAEKANCKIGFGGRKR